MQKGTLLIFTLAIGLKIHKAVVLLWHTDIDLIFCITQTSPTVVEKKKKEALAVLLEERIDPISGTEDPTNTEQLSVKSSDPTTDFISRMKAWVYQMFKDEPSYLGPDSSQARLSLVISPTPSTTWRFTFLAWVLGDLPVSVNKWEWGLFKEPLRCHLTFPDIQHLENLIIPCTFSAKDVRIDSMYL